MRSVRSVKFVVYEFEKYSKVKNLKERKRKRVRDRYVWFSLIWNLRTDSTEHKCIHTQLSDFFLIDNMYLIAITCTFIKTNKKKKNNKRIFFFEKKNTRRRRRRWYVGGWVLLKHLYFTALYHILRKFNTQVDFIQVV